MKKMMLLFLFLPFVSNATYKIAVIDSGFNDGNVKLCSTGHKDFTGTGLRSSGRQHGQNVINIIGDILKDQNYCIINIKYIDENKEETSELLKALMYARELKPDVVNVSGGGPGFEIAEQIVVRKMLNEGVKIIAAAGNERSNLDKECNFYPACDDERVVSVGSVNSQGEISYFSNYGKRVSSWEIGENVSAGGITLSGTSQATVRRTGYFSSYMLVEKARRLNEEINRFIFKYIFYK